ncbi:lipid-A-disaccharide synthase [Candidatus Termititenax dinenymphae]|uniref:Lipid-A-disaccharide synthase n=1 Tax=Candidatus Termititenax dinenymphae TaxID=2218523 RepID=A0A388TJI8_9BACT|nr:lipid-A-disaccharide synthase [Candidatus Termititenax dinenymphae]
MGYNNSMRIFISAVETSGDLHASRLAAALKKAAPHRLKLCGFGSEALAAEGMEILADLTSRSTVGLLEPLRHLPAYFRALSRCKKYLRKNKIDLFLAVDGQGFNLPAAQYAKSLGIPVVYYISPQEWLWGTETAGKKVVEICDLIISIFPEEQRFYRKLGGHSIYNGHPLSEIVARTKVSGKGFRRKHGLAQDKPLIALFPGSRRQELANLLPAFKQIVRLSRGREQFVIAAASKYCNQRLCREIKDIPVVYQENYALMNAADIILSSTGTITLEAALFGTPIIATYKFPRISYWLIKKIFAGKIPKYKALPNMLTGKEIMPERIQQGVTAPELYALLQKTLSNKKKLQSIKKEFQKLSRKLSAPNILDKNAKAVLAILERAR